MTTQLHKTRSVVLSVAISVLLLLFALGWLPQRIQTGLEAPAPFWLVALIAWLVWRIYVTVRPGK